MEPAYVLKQSMSRALIPKILILVVLGIIFYVGVLLNLSLLNLRANEESMVKVISLIVLLFVVILGIFLSFRKARKPYLFFSDRVVFGKSFILYKGILSTAPHQDFWDKMLKTSSINLGNDFHIKHVLQELHVENYLQQLVNYAAKF